MCCLVVSVSLSLCADEKGAVSFLLICLFAFPRGPGLLWKNRIERKVNKVLDREEVAVIENTQKAEKLR